MQPVVSSADESLPAAGSAESLLHCQCGHMYGDQVAWRDGTTQFWELESHGSVQITDVQGRLKKCLPFWKEVLGAPPNILECIENGYRLPLKFIPPSYSQKNHNSAGVHQDFVDEAVHNLIANCCAVEIDNNPTYVVPCWLCRILWGNYDWF